MVSSQGLTPTEGRLGTVTELRGAPVKGGVSGGATLSPTIRAGDGSTLRAASKRLRASSTSSYPVSFRGVRTPAVSDAVRVSWFPTELGRSPDPIRDSNPDPGDSNRVRCSTTDLDCSPGRVRVGQLASSLKLAIEGVGGVI